MNVKLKLINEKKGRGVIAMRSFKTAETIEACPMVGKLPRGSFIPWEYSTRDPKVGAIYGGLAHFYNHSWRANARATYAHDHASDTDMLVMVARHPINKGDEICINYGFTPTEPWRR